MVLSAVSMPLLTHAIQFIRTMCSHLPNIRSQVIFPVSVVMPVYKPAS